MVKLYLIKKIFAISLIGSLPLIIIINWHVRNDYIDSRPKEPKPTEGRVYPMYKHDRVVYLTRCEDFISSIWFIYIGMLCGLLGFTLNKNLKNDRLGTIGEKYPIDKQEWLNKINFQFWLTKIKRIQYSPYTIRKALAVSLLCSTVVFGFIAFYLDGVYLNLRPKQPIPAEGKIYLLEAHGASVYVSKEEIFLSEWLIPIGGLCGVVGGLLYEWNELHRPKK
jgi:hypothetical protein